MQNGFQASSKSGRVDSFEGVFFLFFFPKFVQKVFGQDLLQELPRWEEPEARGYETRRCLSER